MNSKNSPTIQAYSRAAGLAFRIARKNLRNEDGSEVTQEQFRYLLAKALDMKRPVSREMMYHYEAGRTLVPAVVLMRLAHLAAMSLDELMSRAVHQMVHEEWVVIEGCRQAPHPSRISNLVQALREVDAADHPLARTPTTTESERGE